MMLNRRDSFACQFSWTNACWYTAVHQNVHALYLVFCFWRTCTHTELRTCIHTCPVVELPKIGAYSKNKKFPKWGLAVYRCMCVCTHTYMLITHIKWNNKVPNWLYQPMKYWDTCMGTSRACWQIHIGKG